MALTALVCLLFFVLWSAITSLRRRVHRVEQQMAGLAESDARLGALTERLATLEALIQHRSDSAPETAIPYETGAVTLDKNEAPAGPQQPAPQPSAAALPIASPLTSPSVPKAVRPIIAEADPPTALPPVVDTPSPVVPPPPSEAWEVVVGTSWLNKIGVLIFVTGLALLLGYSMTHVGRFGRVLMGFGIGAAMLGAGFAWERRTDYRSYGLGLIAGGWAAIYVTAFAMHAVPAARVIDSDVAGLLVLLVVAAGMVVHSVRFRSETLTCLAYAAAYFPLAITPLTGFSVAASIPLVASLLLVAQRFGWSTISILGVVSTYALLVLRGRVLPGSELDPTTMSPYLLAGANWLLFEAADITARSRRSSPAKPRVALMAVNAVGYFGTLVSFADVNATAILAQVLGLSALGYVVSAVLRARLTRSLASDVEHPQAFSTVHGALAVAAAVAAWAIDLQIEGPRETVLLLVEAELMLAAGVSLQDRFIRRIASAVAVLVSLHAVATCLSTGNEFTVAQFRLRTATSATSLAAAVWYINREWIRRRVNVVDGFEQLYGWLALALVSTVINAEVAFAYQGLSGLVLALALTESGRRLGSDYLWQSRVALGMGVVSTLSVFLGNPPSTTAVWLSLAPASVIAYLYAWRHPRTSTPGSRDAGSIAAGCAAVAGGAFVTILQWRAVSTDWLALTWSLQSLALVWLGRRTDTALTRWQGYFVSFLALVFVSQWAAMKRLAASEAGLDPSFVVLGTACMAYFAAFGVAYLGRTRHIDAARVHSTPVQLETIALAVLPGLTAYFLVAIELLWFSAATRPLVVTVTAAAVLVSGLARRATDIRAISYGVWFVGAMTTLWSILAERGLEYSIWISLAIGVFFVMSLVTRGPLRSVTATSSQLARRIENAFRVLLAIVATALLSLLVAIQASPSLITMAWGLEGVALLTAGFAFRERALRLLGLGLLFLCILKLFLYDLRELEALARILSFVALGVVLLGVSWTYTKYKEEIRKLL